mgnify:CR=1 FL=1
MKTIEKQGKTVEEAIQLALEELKVKREEVDVEVLEEGNRGILGFLSKMAKVRVTVKPKPDEVAAKFLEGLLKHFGISCKIECELEENVLNIVISGDNAGILIGKHGNTLDAIQYLTSLVVNRTSNEFIRVLLDAENYREKREKALQRLARLKKAEGGILAVDYRGRLGAAFNAGQFPVVAAEDGRILRDFKPVNIKHKPSVH